MRWSFSIIFFLAIFFSSCSYPVYVPIDEDMGILEKKGDILCSSSVIITNSPLLVNFNAKYSPIQNLGVFGSYIDVGGPRYGLGVNYYNHISIDKKSNFRYDVGLSTSYGKTRTSIESFTFDPYDLEVKSWQYKLNSSATLEYSKIAFTVGFRLSTYNATKITSYEFYDEKAVKTIIDAEKIFYPEISLRGVIRLQYFDLFTGMVLNNHSQLQNSTLFGTGSLYAGSTLNLHNFFEKW